MKQSLLATVGFDERNLFRAAAAEFQIFQRLFVDGENSACRAVLRRHIGDRCAIG